MYLSKVPNYHMSIWREICNDNRNKFVFSEFEKWRVLTKMLKAIFLLVLALNLNVFGFQSDVPEIGEKVKIWFLLGL